MPIIHVCISTEQNRDSISQGLGTDLQRRRRNWRGEQSSPWSSPSADCGVLSLSILWQLELADMWKDIQELVKRISGMVSHGDATIRNHAVKFVEICAITLTVRKGITTLHRCFASSCILYKHSCVLGVEPQSAIHHDY